MQKQIWYGVKDNQPVFAQDETSLKNANVTEPRSFTVNGDVNGLNFIDSNPQQPASGSTQHA